MKLLFPRVLSLSLCAAVLCGLAPGVARAADPVAGRLSGLIEDSAGEPIRGAEVRLSDHGTGALVASDGTAADGRYSMSPPAGRYDLDVSAERDGKTLAAKVRDVEVGTDSRLNVVLAGDPVESATLSGTLRDGSGNPLPLFDIYAGGHTVTDQDGRFVLEVPEDSSGLKASLPVDSGVVEAGDEDFVLTRDRELDLILPLVTVDAVVRSPDDVPLPDASVRLESNQTCSSCSGAFDLYDGAGTTSRRMNRTRVTGPDGRARFLGLPTSDLTVSVTAAGYEPVQITGKRATGASTTIEVVVPPTTRTAQAMSAAAVNPGEPILSGFLDFAGLFDPSTASVSLAAGSQEVA
ncbi:MAG: carboxypeptidase regulatory-like domain-containing protein, partial [Acidimicrobiia bacterium]